MIKLQKSGSTRGKFPRMMILRGRARRLVARSWSLSWCYYRLHGVPLVGRPGEYVWYFAYGANMHDRAFRERRGMRPLEQRIGRVRGYRLRFNLEGRPRGRAAPANLHVDPHAEVWGVLYKLSRRELLRLDLTEGVPGRGYRPQLFLAEDADGHPLTVIAYIAQGKEEDGNPSLRYLTLIREGARANGLPERWLQFLDGIQHAE
jgi:cation transport regulator ChaC